MASAKEVQLQKELNAEKQRSQQLEKLIGVERQNSLDLSYSLLETLKETLGIQSKSTQQDKDILKIGNVGIGTTTTGFFPGENIKGLTSGALFSVSTFDDENSNDKYNEGDIFESEADLLIDFSESNPFGSF